MRSPIVPRLFAFDPQCEAALREKGLAPAELAALATQLERLDAAALQPGYAPFCKHVFLPNCSAGAPCAVPLAEVPRAALQTAYLARRPQELPVLVRYALRSALSPAFAAPSRAVDVILYSRAQLEAEYAAMREPSALPDADWLVVSLKFQNEFFELPMDPITHFRNTMIAEGGSGAPLDRAAYLQSVAYWSAHVHIFDRDPLLAAAQRQKQLN